MFDSIQHATDRLRELLPIDLPPSVAVYIIGRYEVPPGYIRGNETCLAGTSPTLDLQLRHVLEPEGLWKGRGLAMLISQVTCLYWQPNDFVSLLLHETSHFFDRTPGAVVHRPFEKWPEAIQFLADRPSPTAPEGAVASSPPSSPWSDHGAGFIRAAIHVHHRAQANGFEAPLHEMHVAGDRYGLSPVTDYVEALGDEPAKFTGTPLVEALQAPAPTTFTDLFAADCHRWKQSHGAPAGVLACSPLAGGAVDQEAP